MDSSTRGQSDGGGSSVRVTFADGAARAALERHLDLLHDPARHEGPDVVRIKQNASRTVWRCRLGGCAYYLKHFHPRSCLQRLGWRLRGDDAGRELRFSQRLIAQGVPATPVLAIGQGQGRGWMISRAIEPAIPGDVWHNERAESGDPCHIPTIRAAVLRLAELVGRMHKAGIIHRDLHTGNILVQGEGRQIRLTLMDLHRAAQRRRLSRQACARNLAQLLHDRRHVTTRTQRLAFLKRYLEVTGAPGTLRGWVVITDHFAQAYSRALYGARDRRIFGENRYFTRIRGPHGWRGHAVLASKRKLRPMPASGMIFQAQAWRAVLADPDSLFQSPDAVVIKDSAGSLVIRRRLTIGEHTVEVFIKRHRRKQPYKAIVDALRPSRAIKAFHHGHALLTRRIATALPLAVMERRTGAFLHDSILITEAVAPAEQLNRFLDHWLGSSAVARSGIDAARQQQLARDMLHRLGRLLLRLHSEGFAHRDLKSGNLLVHWTQESPPEIVLVDLDGVTYQRQISTRQMFQGLMRLNVSLLECPSVNHAGRLRMLLGYLRHPGSGRIHFKPYWRELERWSAKKLRRQIASRRKRQKMQRR